MNEFADPQSLASSLVPVPPAPMSFGQILDRSYRLMRMHFRLFFGIALVPTVTLTIFVAVWLGILRSALWPQITAQPAVPPVITPYPYLALILTAFYPIFIAVYTLYMPAACFAANQADRGVTVTFRQAYRFAWSKFGRSLWLLILCFLVMMLPMIVIAVLIGAGTAIMRHTAGAGPAGAFFLIPLLVLLYICIIAYCILVSLHLAVVFPACVEEDITARASLRRSIRLTQGAKGRIFLVMLVIYAATYASELVCLLVTALCVSVLTYFGLPAHVAMGSPVFIALACTCALALVVMLNICLAFPYAAITTVLAVIYHDQRLRKDPAPPTPSPAE